MPRRNRSSSGPYSGQSRNGNARNDAPRNSGSGSVQKGHQNGLRQPYQNQNQTHGQMVPWDGHHIRGQAQNNSPPVQLITPPHTNQYNTHQAVNPAQFGAPTAPWGAVPSQPNVRGRNRNPFTQPQPHNPAQWQHRISKYNPYELDRFRLDSKTMKNHMITLFENFFREMDSAFRGWENMIQMIDVQPDVMDWEATTTTTMVVSPNIAMAPAPFVNPFGNFSSENVFQQGQTGILPTPASAPVANPFSNLNSQNVFQQGQVNRNPFTNWLQGQEQLEQQQLQQQELQLQQLQQQQLQQQAQQQAKQQQAVGNFSPDNPFQSQQASNNSYNPFIRQSAPNFSNFRTRC